MRWGRAVRDPRARRARQRPLSPAGTALLGGALAIATLAGLPRARAPVELDPPAPRLGERATLRLQRAPTDSTQLPVGLGVAVLRTPDRHVLTVIPLQVGRVGIALPPSAADAEPGARTGAADTLWWQVPGLLATATPDSLRPLKAAPPLGPNWWPTILLLAAVLVPPLWWLWRRRRRRAARVLAFPLPVEAAHRVALRRLAEIAASRWLEDGQFDRFFVECTRAVRTYITGRYRVPALDWTSDEIVERLREAGYDRRELADVGPLLAEADRVKFGADRPTQHASVQWLERARAFIERTAVEPVFTTPDAVEAADALTRRAAA